MIIIVCLLALVACETQPTTKDPIISDNTSLTALEEARDNKEQGNYEEAVAKYREYLNTPDAEDSAFYELVRYMIESDEYDDARTEVSAFLDSNEASEQSLILATEVFKDTASELDYNLKLYDWYVINDHRNGSKVGEYILIDLRYEDKEFTKNFFENKWTVLTSDVAKRFFDANLSNQYANDFIRTKFHISGGEVVENFEITTLDLSLLKSDYSNYGIVVNEIGRMRIDTHNLFIFKDKLYSRSKVSNDDLILKIDFDQNRVHYIGEDWYCPSDSCDVDSTIVKSVYTITTLDGKEIYKAPGDLLAVSQNRQFILSADYNYQDGEDNVYEVYDVTNEKIIYTSSFKDGDVHPIDRSQNYRYTASMSDDGSFINLHFLNTSAVVNTKTKEETPYPSGTRVHLFDDEGKPVVYSYISYESSSYELYYMNEGVSKPVVNVTPSTSSMMFFDTSNQVYLIIANNKLLELKEGRVNEIGVVNEKLNLGTVGFSAKLIDSYKKFEVTLSSMKYRYDGETLTSSDIEYTNTNNGEDILNFSDKDVRKYRLDNNPALRKKVDGIYKDVLVLKGPSGDITSPIYYGGKIYFIYTSEYKETGALVSIGEDVTYYDEAAYEVYLLNNELYLLKFDQKEKVYYIERKSDGKVVHKQLGENRPVVVTFDETAYIFDSTTATDSVTNYLLKTKDFENFEDLSNKMGYSEPEFKRIETTIMD